MKLKLQKVKKRFEDFVNRNIGVIDILLIGCCVLYLTIIFTVCGQV